MRNNVFDEEYKMGMRKEDGCVSIYIHMFKLHKLLSLNAIKEEVLKLKKEFNSW